MDTTQSNKVTTSSPIGKVINNDKYIINQVCVCQIFFVP